jgi:hypothetical protein
MKLNRHIYSLVALIVSLVALNLWAWSVLADRRQAAGAAQHDAGICQDLAERIKRLKDKPMVAGSHEIELTELSKRIEQAAVDCQIPASELVRISPEAARRVGDSLYLEKPTTVLLEGVGLHELARFLYDMSNGSAAMDVQNLRLNAPREQETGDRWTAEVTLSYLIYAPKPETNGTSGKIPAAKGDL